MRKPVTRCTLRPIGTRTVENARRADRQKVWELRADRPRAAMNSIDSAEVCEDVGIGSTN